MKLEIVALAFALLAGGCPKDPVPPTPDAGEPDDPDAARPATCAGWCDNARRLGCDAAKPTPGKTCGGKECSCVAVCENMQSSGIAAFNLQCRARARSCAAADACEAR